ncbi:MAG: hypothetical protein UGF89_06345 [Acutalibacteraceae bacterium]|nr:hypothetical protein [Acutalibacteraceae bacterium]
MLFGVQWYYWVILLIAIIIAILAWSKALKAGKARREKMKKEAAIWKRDYELREKFTILTEEKLNSTEETELLHGVAMNIQVELEKATDMNESFNALPQEKKFVYALEYFDEDAKKNLSVFFKNNGEPLISMVPDALNAIGAGKYVEHYATLLPMYDPDSEVSIDYSIIGKVDEEFASAYNSNELLRLSAKYILKNKEIFLA